MFRELDAILNIFRFMPLGPYGVIFIYIGETPFFIRGKITQNTFGPVADIDRPSLKNRFSFIIIDCPPSLGLLTVNSLNASDKIIIPIQGEYYSMEGLAQFTSAVDRVKNALNHKLELEGGILTMFDSRMTLSNQVKEEVVKFFGPKMFESIIPRNIRLAEAPGFGQSIFQYDAKSRGAEAYMSFAREFLSRRGLAPLHAPAVNSETSENPA